MSSCPTRLWEKKRSWFSSPESTCLAFPAPVCFGATHPACEPLGCFVHVRGATGVDEDWPRSFGTTVIMLPCPLWLISWMLVIGKEMTRLIMENTMTIMSFDESGEWWVNGWTGPFRIILSVLTALLQVQHDLAYILAYILHITHSADRAQRRTNPQRDHVP